MPQPFLEHVQRDAVDGRVDSEPVPQSLRAALRRVGDAGLDHDARDDLPDPHPAQRPDRRLGLFSGSLGLADAMRGVERVQVIRRDRDRPVDQFGAAGSVPALLQGSDRNRAAGEIHAGGRDLDQLGGPAAGEVQRLAQRAVARRLAPGRGQEGGAFLGIQVEPVAGRVVEAHVAHGKQFTGEVLSREAERRPLPGYCAGPEATKLNTMANSVKRRLLLSFAIVLDV